MEALARIVTWDEVREDRSRTVTASWVTDKGLTTNLVNRSSWDPDTRSMLMDLRSDDHYRDGRVVLAERRTLIGFYEETPVSTKVEYATEMVFGGQLRRRDFLPGIVARRRNAHRSRVQADITACEKALRGEP